jgi:hypothetical protein
MSDSENTGALHGGGGDGDSDSDGGPILSGDNNEKIGRWTKREQAAFVQGINESGRNWKYIARLVGDMPTSPTAGTCAGWRVV